MKILAITLLVALVLGFLFIQWANKPENVAALQKKRAQDAAQEIENKKKQAVIARENVVIQKEIETKKGAMTLAVDENFSHNRFEKLDFKYSNISYFKFEKNELNFSGMVFKGQNAQDYFMSSTDEYGDFTAEIQLGIWGGDSFAGIFWGAADYGNLNPKQYQAAYSSPNTLYIEAGDKEHFGLGDLISSENNQLLRVERVGKHVTVSVNSRILFDETVESAERGKVGILVGHRGGIRPNTQSMSIGIKHFKVWH